MSKTPDWINEVIRDVAELPYRDSPPDQPEMMLVTGDELRDILENARPQIEAEAKLVIEQKNARIASCEAALEEANARVAEARAAMVEQCLNAIRGEYCVDELMDPTDEAYNSALDHAVEAIRALAALPPTHVCVPVEFLYEIASALRFVAAHDTFNPEHLKSLADKSTDLLAASKGDA